MQLKQISTDIWVYDGSTVHFYGSPFPTRMTVIRLSDGNLWLHSPEKINDELVEELLELGRVRYLVSPNKLHHLFLNEWIDRFPDAVTYAAPGISAKRQDICFDTELCDSPEPEWADELEQTIFRGSPAMEEVVFLHKPSRTLILTDLIENLESGTLNWWQRNMARFAGTLHPHGKMPVDWRLSYLFGNKKAARKSLGEIIQWDPENIIMCHGECVFGEAQSFLETSFQWLMQNN